MSRIAKNILMSLGVVFLILVALHLFAAPLMAQLVHFVHGR
jgi:hypothetical protein